MQVPVSRFDALDDSALLDHVLGRDARAFAELVRRHRGLLFRCIGRVIGRYERIVSSPCVDDVFAETCVLLWSDDLRRLRAFDASRGMKLPSWMGLIATHAAWDHLRRVRRRPQHDTLDALADHPVDDATPDALASLLAAERRGTLRSITDVLSKRDLEFVQRYFAEDHSPEDVARSLGVSVKTVYSKKHKITNRLRARAREVALAA